MLHWRSVQLNSTLQERPGLDEKPAVRLRLLARMRLRCEPELGLREFEQRTRIGVDRVPGTLEILMGRCEVLDAMREDGRIDRILYSQLRAALSQQLASQAPFARF